MGVERSPDILLRIRLRDPLGEVLAGAKSATRAGQQEGATGGIGFALGHGSRKRAVHRLIERIEASGPVQRDHAIAGTPVDEEAWFGHERSSPGYQSAATGR